MLPGHALNATRINPLSKFSLVAAELELWWTTRVIINLTVDLTMVAGKVVHEA